MTSKVIVIGALANIVKGERKKLKRKLTKKERAELLAKYYGGGRDYWLKRLLNKRNSIRGTEHRR